MNEKQLENLILDYLNFRGCFAWKNQTTGIYDPTRKAFRRPFNKHHVKGIPDIIGMTRGAMFTIEVKAPLKSGNKRKPESLFKLLSDEQKEYFRKSKFFGVPHLVTDNIDDVKDFISCLQNADEPASVYEN